jgi:hypothetical protein
MVHIDNLSKLLDWGGDYAPQKCVDQGLTKRVIHHGHIMDRRKSRQVPCRASSSLADYVPFYFRTRSPMLFAINKGGVEGYAGQSDLIYLQSTAEAIAGAGLDYVFSNGHAVMEYADFFDDLTNLDKIPWEVVGAKYWNDHEDGRFKCQSEFLVRDFFPLSQIATIGVFNEAMAQKVREQLEQQNKNIDVTTQRSWYF